MSDKTIDEQPIFIGGGTSQPLICNEADFYITMRGVENERRLAGDAPARPHEATYLDIHRSIVAVVLGLLATQLGHVVAMVVQFERLITARIALNAKKNRASAVNMTLPTLVCPEISASMPLVATITVVNDAVQYLRRLDVNVILAAPVRIDIEPVTYPRELAERSRTLGTRVEGTADEIYAHQIHAAEYSRDVEHFAIGVIVTCGKIIDAFTAIIHAMKK